MLDSYISTLCRYAERTGLLQPEDLVFARNALLEALQLDSFDEAAAPAEASLADILQVLTGDAVARGVCPDNQVARDLFDTKLMGVLTPRPHEVRTCFHTLYQISPQKATDWFYRFSQDTNYIRRDRIARDRKWQYQSPYGALDITINLSKPEKDPRAIAAARLAPQSAYPKCQLCCENEGYAGRMNHPARQNHRVIPLTINGAPWYLQYSPYVYYPEHCIVLSGAHTPMKIDRAAFAKLLDFVKEKWDAGELDNAEDIKAAISEGEKEFGVSLDESTRTTLASALQQLNGIGLNHETVIALAQKMYESYGDTLVENLSDALQEQLAGPLGETIQEQLIEPAKETVMETAKAIAANTAQHFWQDLKQSVIDFLNHVFQKGKN